MKFLLVLGIILVISSFILIRSRVFEDKFSKVRVSPGDFIMAIFTIIGWICIVVSVLWWSLIT